MITIEIKLQNNAFGACPWSAAPNEGKTEIIPSPLRIIRSILSGMYQDSYIKTEVFNNLTEGQIITFDKLVTSSFSYYIPQYSHAGSISYYPDYTTSLRNIAIEGKENQSSSRINFDPHIVFDEADNKIIVFIDNNLTATERGILSDALTYLTYLGRSEYSAEWKLLRQNTVKPNCFEDRWGEEVDGINNTCEDLLLLLSSSPEQIKEMGYRLPPFIRKTFYRLDAIRSTQVDKKSVEYGQVAYIAIDPALKIPKEQMLSITNVAHKYICKSETSQAIGKDEYGQFVSDEEAIYFLPDIMNDEIITGIKIECKSQIDPLIIQLLMKLQHLKLNGQNIPVKLVGISQREKKTSKRFRSKVFANTGLEVRKSVRRSAEGIFLKHCMELIGADTKTAEYIQDDDLVIAKCNKGNIKCKAYQLPEKKIVFRGNRHVASDNMYLLSIELDQPYDIIALGGHFRFGLGQLEPY